MKVVALMGSPHKGNTLELTQIIEKKLKEPGDVEFEYIHLKEKDIRMCRGCFLCFMKGEERCPLKDDVSGIVKKMDEADGVIFVTPVYSMHVSSLLKTFIDRAAYIYHRPRFFDKYAIGIGATGNLGLKETLSFLKGTAMCWGFEYVDSLGYIATAKNTTLKPIAKMKDRTDEVVRKFHRKMLEKKPRKLTLIDYVMFRSTQAVFSKMEKMSPTDYKYYKDNGWLDKKTAYFSNNIRKNFFFDIITRLMAGMMSKKIDKVIEEEKAS